MVKNKQTEYALMVLQPLHPHYHSVIQ